MMKKNMKMLALMALLSAGYSYLICSNSDSSSNNETSVSTQAQQMVSDAFESLVNLTADPLVDNYYPKSNNDEIPMENAIKSINSSLMALGKSFGNLPVIKQIAKAASDTVKFFAEKSTTGSSYTINRKVFLPIVNSLKLAVTVPTQIAVRASMTAGDIAAGALMGAASGLALGLTNTRAVASEEYASHNSWAGVAQDFSSRVIAGLVGIVGTPALVAYGAGHGISRAIVVSYTQGRDNVGLGYAQPDNGSFADQFNPVPAKPIDNLSGNNSSDNFINSSNPVPTDKVQTANDLYKAEMNTMQKYLTTSTQNDLEDESNDRTYEST